MLFIGTKSAKVADKLLAWLPVLIVEAGGIECIIIPESLFFSINPYLFEAIDM